MIIYVYKKVKNYLNLYIKVLDKTSKGIRFVRLDNRKVHYAPQGQIFERIFICHPIKNNNIHLFF